MSPNKGGPPPLPGESSIYSEGSREQSRPAPPVIASSSSSRSPTFGTGAFQHDDSSLASQSMRKSAESSVLRNSHDLWSFDANLQTVTSSSSKLHQHDATNKPWLVAGSSDQDEELLLGSTSLHSHHQGGRGRLLSEGEHAAERDSKESVEQQGNTNKPTSPLLNVEGSSILDAAELSQLLDDHHDVQERLELGAGRRRTASLTYEPASPSSSAKNAPLAKPSTRGASLLRSQARLHATLESKESSSSASNSKTAGNSSRAAVENRSLLGTSSLGTSNVTTRNSSAPTSGNQMNMNNNLQQRGNLLNTSTMSASSRLFKSVAGGVAAGSSVARLAAHATSAATGILPPAAAVAETSLATKVESIKAQHGKHVEGLHTQLNKAEEALQRRDAKFSESREATVVLRKQNMRLEKELGTQLQSVEKLKQAQRETESSLTTAQQQNRKLEARIFQLQQTSKNLLKIEQLEKDLELCQKHEAEAQEEATLLGADNENLTKEVSILNRALAVHADEIGVEQRLLYDYGQAREELDVMKTDLAKLKGELAVVERDRDEFRLQAEQVRGNLEREMTERKEHERRAQHHESLNGTMEEHLSNLRDQKLELEKKHDHLVSELAQTHRSLAEARGHHTRLEVQVGEHELRATKTQLDTEGRVQMHLERVQELSGHAENIQSQLDQQREVGAEERRKRKEAEAKVLELEDKMAFLKRKYDAIDKIQCELDEEQRGLQERSIQLEADLSDTQSKRNEVQRKCEALQRELDQ
ncbi:unnamed protein product, partial [Amoebophrya sp. A120]|eukprot:GSA120T00002793001.1